MLDPKDSYVEPKWLCWVGESKEGSVPADIAYFNNSFNFATSLVGG
jgi:hypothetical protein